MPHSPWLQSHSGKAIDLLRPNLDAILIEDIAHALSKICRYTGHTTGVEIYSVAARPLEVPGAHARRS